MNRRQLLRTLGGAATVPILSGCTVLDALDDKRVEVEITANGTYEPGGITIRAGDTVVWRNNHTGVHRLSTDPTQFEEGVPVTVPDGATGFTSNDILANERFMHTFDVPGDYIYACTIHPTMIGTITVEPADS